MKKTTSTLLVMLIAAFSFGQTIEITPMVGYQFGGKVNFIQGDLKVQDNMNYGGIISYSPIPMTTFEFSYSRMSTTAEWRPFAFYESDFPADQFDLSIGYFQFAGLRMFKDGPVQPFGLFSLGWTHFNPDNEINSSSRFSIALGGGVKLFFNDVVGIRLQGRLLMPMYFNGVGGYVGIGPGGPSTGLGVSTSVPILQGDLSGGLILRINR